MRWLVDAHTLLWAADKSSRLGTTAKSLLADSNNAVFVSVATLWDLAIKANIGKLSIPDDFNDRVLDSGYDLLELHPDHLDAYRALPLHHRDPFDRVSSSLR